MGRLRAQRGTNKHEFAEEKNHSHIDIFILTVIDFPKQAEQRGSGVGLSLLSAACQLQRTGAITRKARPE